MSKSRETFSKKEKEKQRIKKRKDKAEKREERKANSDKGKSLEEMFVYIDENGNMSSTPPDPKKKKIIRAEDVVIGVQHEPVNEADLIRTGIVTFFNESKGYGFIKDLQSQDSVFVHVNNLTEEIKERDKVTFEVEAGPKGLNAKNVKAAV